MEAVSQAAAEITAEMPSGGVDVRLNGRELEFAVHTAPPPPPGARRPPDGRRSDDDGNVARITLRIPESVKAKAEERPTAPGTRSTPGWSTWCAPRPATRRSTSTSTCPASRSSAATTRSAAKRGNKRMTGWV